MLTSSLKRSLSILPSSLSYINNILDDTPALLLPSSTIVVRTFTSIKSIPLASKNKNIVKVSTNHVKLYPIELNRIDENIEIPINLLRSLIVLDNVSYLDILSESINYIIGNKYTSINDNTRDTIIRKKISNLYLSRWCPLIWSMLSNKQTYNISHLSSKLWASRFNVANKAIEIDLIKTKTFIYDRLDYNINNLPLIFEIARLCSKLKSLEYIWTDYKTLNKSVQKLNIKDLIRAAEVDEEYELVKLLKSWIISNDKNTVLFTPYSTRSEFKPLQSLPDLYKMAEIPKNQEKVAPIISEALNNAKLKMKIKIEAKKALKNDQVKVPVTQTKKIISESSTQDNNTGVDSKFIWKIPTLNHVPMSGEVTAYKIYIDNLPINSGPEEIRQAFENFGEVTRVDIFFDRLNDFQLDSDKIAHLKQLKNKSGTFSSVPSKNTMLHDPFHLSKSPKSDLDRRLLDAESVSPVYAFLYFKNADSMRLALAPYMRLFGMVMEGRACRVYEAQEKSTLWLSKLKVDLTPDELRNEIKRMFRHQRFVDNAAKPDTEKNDKLLIDVSTISISLLTNPKCYAIEFSSHNDAQLAFSVIRKYKNVVSAPPPSPVSTQEAASSLDFNVEKGTLNTSGITIAYSGGIGGHSFRVDWISPVSDFKKSNTAKLKIFKDHLKERAADQSKSIQV